jgi:predicted AlkP superfamily phosphohydrolase/phosphomutase
MDPTAPALPISTPENYVTDLAARAGNFYTQGLPEDTAALTASAIGDESYIELADDIYAERRRLMEVELERFSEGVLFLYFGGVDQVSHMFWRTYDAQHPAHDSELHRDAILDSYRHLDDALGRVFKAIGAENQQLDKVDTTLIVLSDHGFAPFARAAHLNSWLRDEGFLRLRGRNKTSRELFSDVDWAKTRAYALGLNGLYMNQRGRERYGAVSPNDREQLLAEVTRRLLSWKDPETGRSVVKTVYRPEDIYSETYRELSPDLVIGYARGYRSSNESALVEVPENVLEDNLNKWSGDHCIAADEVPGVLLVNGPIVGDAHGL